MKHSTKMSITLTYGEWISLMRAFSFALGEMEKPTRTSEKVMMIADCRAAKEKLLKKVAERRAKSR